MTKVMTQASQLYAINVPVGDLELGLRVLYMRRHDAREMCNAYEVIVSLEGRIYASPVYAPSECSNRVWVAPGQTYAVVPSCLTLRSR